MCINSNDGAVLEVEKSQVSMLIDMHPMVVKNSNRHMKYNTTGNKKRVLIQSQTKVGREVGGGGKLRGGEGEGDVKKSGESGHRSRYLSHAKRALYHLS